MSKARPRFYVNPYSGRMIKTSGEKYKSLKKEFVNIDKHKCLYNIKSAERCLKRLTRLYPNIIYPSSNFRNIPKTYKKGKARSFIIDNKKSVVGYVDKNGKLKRLMTPVDGVHNKIPIVKDPTKSLSKIIKNFPKINNNNQKLIENQIYNETPMKKIPIIYNPIQNDFIPIKKNLDKATQQHIINTINEELIPNTLPTISKNGILSTVSGIIKVDDRTIGIVDKNNQLKHFVIKQKDNDNDKLTIGIIESSYTSLSSDKSKIKENKELWRTVSSEIIIEVPKTKSKIETAISTEAVPEVTDIESESEMSEIESKESETESEISTEPESEISEIESKVPSTKTSFGSARVPLTQTTDIESETESEISTEPESEISEIESKVPLPKTSFGSARVPSPTLPLASQKTVEVPEMESETESEILSEPESEMPIPKTVEVSESEMSETESEISSEPESEISIPKTVEVPETEISSIESKVTIPKTIGISEKEVPSGTESVSEIESKIPESEPKVSDVEIKIPSDVEIITKSEKDMIDLKEMIKKSPELSEKETVGIIKELKCLDGEQYDVHYNRCIPCDKYDLVWDPEYSKCKMIYKEEEVNNKKNIILVSSDNEIVGYL